MAIKQTKITSKIMKKVFFGLAVALVALSASAFTNATKLATGSIYVQDADDSYNLISPANYLLGICDDADDSPCAVEVTDLGTANNVESFAPYTDAEIATYTSAGWLAIKDSSTKLFVR
jgi:hypothetical protein